MTRAELRLQLFRIVHHDRHNIATVIDIVSKYEAAFADLVLDDDEKPKPAAPKKSAA